MNTDTRMCAACRLSFGPGTLPGFTVVKRKPPSSAVGMRPKPSKPFSRGFSWVSSGCAYLPAEFACQTSNIASGTPWPSASITRPSMTTRWPETLGPTRLSLYSHSRPIRKKGPTVCHVVAWKLISRFPGRGVAAADDDVELVAHGFLRNGGMPIELGDQAVAGPFVGDTIKNGIVGKQRIAGKIHLRD